VQTVGQKGNEVLKSGKGNCCSRDTQLGEACKKGTVNWLVKEKQKGKTSSKGFTFQALEGFKKIPGGGRRTKKEGKATPPLNQSQGRKKSG